MLQDYLKATQKGQLKFLKASKNGCRDGSKLSWKVTQACVTFCKENWCKHVAQNAARSVEINLEPSWAIKTHTISTYNLHTQKKNLLKRTEPFPKPPQKPFQDPPKTPQTPSKTPQRPSKMLPRCSQDDPRWSQNGLKMAQDDPKMAQDGPKMAEDILHQTVCE